MAPTSQRRGLGLLIVMSSFVMLALALGTMQSLGIYMVSLAYEFDDPGSGILGWLFSSCTAIGCLLGPISSTIVDRFGCRCAAMCGGVLLASGLIVSSLLSSLSLMFLFMGAVTGFGGSLIHTSIPVILGHHFTTHYSAAIGTALSGIGFGVILLPPLLSHLISVYGWRGALQIHGGIALNIVAMAALFKPTKKQKYHDGEHLQNQIERDKSVEQMSCQRDIKRVDSIESLHMLQLEEFKDGAQNRNEKPVRRPTTCSTKSSRIPSILYVKHVQVMVNFPALILIWMTSICLAIGFLGTAIHVVYQSRSKGYSSEKSSAVLTSMGCGGLVGRLICGWLVDKKLLRSTSLYELCLLFAAVGSFLNPLLDSYAGFVISSLIIGLAGGILFPMVYPIVKDMVGMHMLATAAGLTSFAEGCGTLIGGFLAGALKDITGNYTASFCLFGGTFLLGAILFFPILVMDKKNILHKNEGLVQLKNTV